MSIEKALADNTAALMAFIAAISENGAPATSSTEAKAETKPTAAEKKAQADAKKKADAEKKKAAEEEAAESEAAAPGDVKEFKASLLKLVEGRSDAVDVAKGFLVENDYENTAEVPEDQWVDFLTRFEAHVAALGADL